MQPDLALFPQGSLVALTGILGMSLAAVLLRLISPSGGMAGSVVALFIWAGGGWPSLFLLFFFFSLASLATLHRAAWKDSLKLSEHSKDSRSVANVLANGSPAAVAGLLAWIRPELSDPAFCFMAGSLAASLSDTMSSELGNVYGRRFYNIIGLRPDLRGRDGVVSYEGTAAGIAGAVVLAISAAFLNGWLLFIPVAVGGLAGNLVDSLLGASAERRGWIGNHAVNALCAISGGLVAAWIGC